MKSWKTSFGAIVLLLAVIFGQIGLVWDGDPLTNPDWNLVIAEIGAAFGLWFARDNNVTSEDVKGRR